MDQEKRIRKTAQSNALVRAEPEKKTVSIFEGIIKQLLLLKMQDLYRDHKDPFVPLELSVDEIMAETSISYADIYKFIEDSASHLCSYRVRFERALKNRRRVDFIPFFARISYDTGVGTVTALFNSEIRDHLVGLTENFTLIEWDSFKELHLISGQKLFELLLSYKSVGVAEIPLTEIHTVMQSTDYQRENYRSFNQVVLTPAIKDIRENAKWWFDVTAKRRARKVVSLVFDFTAEGEQRARDKAGEKAIKKANKKLEKLGIHLKKKAAPEQPKRPRGRPRKVKLEG